MKKYLIFISILTFTTILYSHGQELKNKPIKNSTSESQEANIQMRMKSVESQEDTVSQYQKFIETAEIKIDNNEIIINGLREKLSEMSDKEQKIMVMKVGELEQANSELRNDLERTTENNQGEAFQAEFIKRLELLEKAINNHSK